MDRIEYKRKDGHRASKFRFFTFTLLFAALAFSTATIIFDGFKAYAVACEFPTVIRTEYGRVKGILDDNNILSWKGIPFAKPPVGDLRWKRPEKPDRWDGVKQTVEFCDECTQYAADAKDIIGSEDCLYLNVWRPNSKKTKLPVYFWIHGGGNSTGTAGLSMYDGSKIAGNGNLIVVTPNYRLGPLGWFTHPVLRKGKKGTAMSDSGNYGTLDIIMALKWVRENIKAFGGDPNNVTIGGESAGAWDVYMLLISPAAEGLFHKAMAQSGVLGFFTNSVADGDASADKKIDALMAIDGISRDGMKDNQIAHYLRSKTDAEILSLYEPGFGGMLDVQDTPEDGDPVEFFMNFRDGAVIHKDGFEVLVSGDYNKVPIILGNNKEEMKLFMYPYLPYMFPCAYQAATEYFYIEPLTTDLVAQTLRMNQTGVYVYRFNYGAYRYDPSNNCEPDPLAFNAWMDLRPWGGPNFALMFGACHMLDVPFFFGNFEFLGLENYIFNGLNFPGYKLLSDAMMAYVAQFAHTGDPGDAGGVHWTPWENTATGQRIIFDADKDATLIEMSTP